MYEISLLIIEQFSILNDTVCERTSMNSVQIVLANPVSKEIIILVVMSKFTIM